MPEPPAVPARPRRARAALVLRAAAPWLGAGAGLLGLVGFSGWVFDVPALRGILPGAATMKANTALAMLCSGGAAALMFARRGRGAARGLAAALAGLAALVGAATLLEFAAGMDLGLDELLFADPPGSSLPYHPGRMAPTTASCFLLAGLALLLSWRARDRHSAASEALALAVLLFAFVSLVGYVFRVRATGPVTFHTTQMAIHTSTGFALLSAALLCSRAEAGLLARLLSPRTGGLASRRLLPVAVGVPLVAGGAFLAGARAGLYGSEFAFAGLVVLTVAAASVVIWSAAGLLNRLDVGRQRAEAALRRLNASLERRVAERTSELASAYRELEAFVHSISHDLATPLRSVEGFAALLQRERGEALGPEGRADLARIRAAAKHMDQLMGALLEMSRLARAELGPEPVDLSAIASSTLAALAARDPGRTVETRVRPGLVARGDPRLLGVVMQNLLENAWKFTGKTDRAVVEFGARGEGPEREYFVRDNGAGFDPALAPRLFRPFQRLHTEAEFPGHGVGLATTQRLVERHGGRLRAEGTPGGGACFSFTIGTG